LVLDLDRPAPGWDTFILIVSVTSWRLIRLKRQTALSHFIARLHLIEPPPPDHEREMAVRLRHAREVTDGAICTCFKQRAPDSADCEKVSN
jgi:hypothetical protein